MTDTQKKNIDEVIAYYAPHDAQWLSNLAHLEAPWKEARHGIKNEYKSDAIITKESMSIYYGGLQ